MSRRRSGPLSPKEIEDRFEEAARTLRRLPEEKPQGYFSVWPAIVRTTWEIMAMERQPMVVWATPQSIDRMDECFAWLFWLEPEEARIVWMRAERMRWKPICRRLGVSRATAWRWWAAALIKISHRLAADAKASLPKNPRKQAS
jgi:predicted DNA-binding protein (UPF0251 family)